jgi:hypothetical protein
VRDETIAEVESRREVQPVAPLWMNDLHRVHDRRIYTVRHPPARPPDFSAQGRRVGGTGDSREHLPPGRALLG